MNGATTDPWVNTSRAPIRTIVMIRGASQYFFLTLRKSQTSFSRSKKASIVKSEDTGEIDVLVLGLLPVGLKPSTLALQRIVTGQTHDVGNGLKHKDEDGTKDQVTVDPT